MRPLTLRVAVAPYAIDALDPEPGGAPRPASFLTRAHADALGARARALDVRRVRLSGGEPLLHPEWGALVEGFVAAGLDTDLVTCGRLLLYPERARQVASAPLRRVVVALHGARGADHDARAGVPGAFRQVMAGLARLAALSACPPLDLLVPLRATRLADLAPLAARAARLGVGRLCLVPPASAEAPRGVAAVRAALEALEGAPLPWRVASLPPCWLPEPLDLARLDPDPLAHLVADPMSGALHAIPSPAVAFAPACLRCSLREACPGLPGSSSAPDAVAPVIRAIPNAIPFVDQGPLADDGGCAVADRDPDRHLILEGPRGRRLLEARPDPAFPLPRRALVETRARGLVYVNLSGRARIDDFRTQLQRLVPVPCPCRVQACPGHWGPAPGPILATEEGRLEALLDDLRGEVLDVGFGPCYQRARFARLHDDGRIRYRGLEPDEDAVRALRAMRPDWDLRVGSLEDPPPDLPPADHVLLLRSWNHLVDLDEALASLARLLRPGGRLVVADNVRFGYHLAPDAQPESGGRYEHYRNHDLADAEVVLVGAGYHVTLRVPLAPGGDNQWLLQAERS